MRRLSRQSPVYDRARAALVHGDVSRDLVLGLKYQGRRDGLGVLAGWMASAGKELLAEANLIVPLPLHYFRLVRRGFNQSAWLAAALSRSSGVRLSVEALTRVNSTPIQGGLRLRVDGARCRGRSGSGGRGSGWGRTRKSCWSMMF